MVTSSSDYGLLERDRDGQNVRTTFSYPMYQQFVADNQTIGDLFACAPFGRVNVVVDGQAELASAFISTGNYYQVLGVDARLGRTICRTTTGRTRRRWRSSARKYWHSRFGTDPASSARPSRSTTSSSPSSACCRRSSRASSSRRGTAPDISVPLALDTAVEHRLPRPAAATEPSRPTGGCRSWAG